MTGFDKVLENINNTVALKLKYLAHGVFNQTWVGVLTRYVPHILKNSGFQVEVDYNPPHIRDERKTVSSEHPIASSPAPSKRARANTIFWSTLPEHRSPSSDPQFLPGKTKLDLSERNSPFAIVISQMINQGKGSSELKEAIARSHNLLAKKGIDSPFIQKIIASHEGTKYTAYAEQGDLIDYLNQGELNTLQDLTPDRLKALFGQLASALSDIHSNNIVHRDIKSVNVLVTMFQNEPQLLLADWDTAIEVNESGFPKGNTNAPGAELYMAPEWREPALKIENAKDRLKYYLSLDAKATDVYALGVTFEDMLLYRHFDPVFKYTLRRGCEQDNGKYQDVLRDLLEVRITDENPQMDEDSVEEALNQYEDIIELISWMLNPDPEKRPSIETVKNHRLFGDTPEKRAQFFQELQAKFAQNELRMGDTKLNTAPQSGDLSQIFSEGPMKDVYVEAQALNKLYKHIIHQLPDVDHQRPKNKREKEALNQALQGFHQKCDEVEQKLAVIKRREGLSHREKQIIDDFVNTINKEKQALDQKCESFLSNFQPGMNPGSSH